MQPSHNRLIIFALSVLAGFTAHGTELQSTTPVAAKTNGEKWWNGNCERIDADIKKMDGKVDVAFVGDSITARWRGSENWTKHWGAYRAVNMGIGGDQTQHVLWRLQNGDLDGYQAKLFVVMIGTNNMWANDADPAHAAAGVYHGAHAARAPARPADVGSTAHADVRARARARRDAQAGTRAARGRVV
jgi:hypothetical protein